jgi:hypothetical protein
MMRFNILTHFSHPNYSYLLGKVQMGPSLLGSSFYLVYDAGNVGENYLALEAFASFVLDLPVCCPWVEF